MSANLRYVPVAPESALANTGSGTPDGLANAADAVSTNFFFNTTLAFEPFSLGGEKFVTV
jgi:hypothetical protein